MAKLDRGQLATERSYADVQRRLKRNYRQAVHEVQQKMDDFNKRYKAADIEKRKQLSEGKITKADYDSWKRGQVYQGKLWQQKRDSLTETLYQADVLSTKIVNSERLNVFTANANHICYNLEHTAGLDFGFSVYDNATVSKLLKDEPTLLPPRKVKHSEDVDWYHKIINNCVTQGIIQGESIQEIAKRIAETTGERGEHAAIRNARTAMTAAQNAGRIEAMHEAQALGIKLQKRWLATLDSRTRDSHQHLDGQVQNVDDPFESDYGYIMFPGDPWAEPADVYNCRCTLLYEHPEYPSDIPRRDNINGEIIEDMTYDEWAAAKRDSGEAFVRTSNPLQSRRIPDVRNTLIDEYNYHREHNNLTNLSAEQIIDSGKKYNDRRTMFDADLSKLDEAGRDNIAKAANELCRDYDTPLSTIGTMSGKEALGNRAFAVTRHNYENDTAEILINPIKCRNTQQYMDRLRELRDKGYLPKGVKDEQLGEYVFTHEFGHSLINMEQPLNNKRNWVNADYSKIRSARKEIEKIYGDYAQEIGKLDGERKAAEMDFMLNLDMAAAEKAKKMQARLDREKVSTYSLTNSDEFVAESFAAIRFGATESTYARRCADVIDKYFRR